MNHQRVISGIALVSIVGLMVSAIVILFRWVFPIATTDSGIPYWLVVSNPGSGSRILLVVSFLGLVYAVWTTKNERWRGRLLIALAIIAVVGCGLSLIIGRITTSIDHRTSATLGDHLYQLALRRETGTEINESWYELYKCDPSGNLCDRTDFHAPYAVSILRRIEENVSLTASEDRLVIRINEDEYEYRP
jgi:hypothetical protein